MQAGIYLYSFKNTSIGLKSYVGSTIDLHRRYRDHLNDLSKNTHRNQRLQNAYNKYGKENLIYEILEEIGFPDTYDKVLKREYLESRECYWEEKLGCKYNIRKPGLWTKVSDKIELSKQYLSMKKPVYRVTKDLEIIQKYSCARDACRELGLTAISVSKVARVKQGHTKGYYFRFPETLLLKYDDSGKQRPSIRKAVICYNLDRTFYAEYSSITEASKKLSISEWNISSNCNNLSNRVSSYIFRFQETLLPLPVKMLNKLSCTTSCSTC